MESLGKKNIIKKGKELLLKLHIDDGGGGERA